jgi:hypothetical protein
MHRVEDTLDFKLSFTIDPESSFLQRKRRAPTFGLPQLKAQQASELLEIFQYEEVDRGISPSSVTKFVPSQQTVGEYQSL